jgi:putative nucleotidyltransferase with HDIG domain
VETFDDVLRSYTQLEDLFMGFVKATVNALDAKSSWTRGHSERVTAFAQEITCELGLRDRDRRDITLASLLHDIGKIGTSGNILNKCEQLSPEEFDIVKKHPVQGAEILKGIKHFDEVIHIIKHHHEWMDGSGYPDGLRGAEIPLGSRIVHVADAFDSMTEHRPYRKAMSIDDAVKELNRCSGTQFDPLVVNAWLSVLDMHEDWLLQFKQIASDSESIA